MGFPLTVTLVLEPDGVISTSCPPRKMRAARGREPATFFVKTAYSGVGEHLELASVQQVDGL